MLIGQTIGKISDKHQAAFPKRFRESLGDKLIITKGIENYLIVVSEKNWETLLEGTQGKPFINKSSREMQRYLLGNAAYVELDEKGRFVIPEHLRKHANLSEEIVFAGISRFVEIWSKEAWDTQQASLAENIGSIAEKLNETNE